MQNYNNNSKKRKSRDEEIITLQDLENGNVVANNTKRYKDNPEFAKYVSEIIEKFRQLRLMRQQFGNTPQSGKIFLQLMQEKELLDAKLQDLIEEIEKSNDPNKESKAIYYKNLTNLLWNR